MWRRGDKAACVWKAPVNDGLEVGRVYTVAGLAQCSCNHYGQTQPALLLVELPSPFDGLCGLCGKSAGWFADRFRKVVDDKREAGNECPALLDFIKKPEKVDA